MAFQTLVSNGISKKAAEVLQDMAKLTTVIECHTKGVNAITDMTLFIDRRNSIQHRLISLPIGEDLNNGEASNILIYDAVRYTAMIYGAAVIFPLPALQGVFRKLATRLREVIGENGFNRGWQDYPKTLLWVLVLGGVAALETTERYFYVQKLACLSTIFNILEWDDIVIDLKNHLWLESACHAGGRDLWDEIIHERNRS